MQLQAWLDLICRMIPDVKQALLVVGSSANVQARWPADAGDPSELLSAAGLATTQRKTVITAEPASAASSTAVDTLVAYPLSVDEAAYGTVVIRLQLKPAQQTLIMQMLSWAQAWLQLLLSNGSDAPGGMAGYQPLLQAVEHCQRQGRLETVAAAVTTALAQDLGCERVSLGMVDGPRLRICGVSHSGNFDPRLARLRALEPVMRETLPQPSVLVQAEPSSASASAPLADAMIDYPAHRQLLAAEKRQTLCSVPLTAAKSSVGVLLFEFGDQQPFSADRLALCETLGRVLGPLLALKQQRDRPLWKKLLSQPLASLSESLGARRLRTLGVTTIVIAGLLMTVLNGDYRVTAPASLEGRIQRAVVAPFEGYIAQSFYRAGEIVQSGEVIAELEVRQMLLEQQRLMGQQSEHDRQYRQALAAMKKAQAHIYRAQLEQADAELTLLQQKIQRAKLLSPLDGVIIAGDLSRSLGAPVSQGEVLFEVAPLDEYRLVVRVSEDDIVSMQPGLPGLLTLKALPDEPLAFRVAKVSPVFEEQASAISYRVEALFEQQHPALRPGMQGIAKISVGPRSYAWIYLHELINAIRLWTWRWLP